MAKGGSEIAKPQVRVDWVHDCDEADSVITELASGHADTVVLLKGSHASGLSALAERWQALAAK